MSSRSGYAIIFATLGAILAFSAWRGSVPDEDSDAGRTLSRHDTRGRDLDTVRAHEPQLTLVRGESSWIGRLEAASTPGQVPERLELVGPDGRIVAGEDLDGVTARPLAFTLPLDARGAFVARVRYASGETWTVEATL